MFSTLQLWAFPAKSALTLKSKGCRDIFFFSKLVQQAKSYYLTDPVVSLEKIFKYLCLGAESWSRRLVMSSFSAHERLVHTDDLLDRQIVPVQMETQIAASNIRWKDHSVEMLLLTNVITLSSCFCVAHSQILYIESFQLRHKRILYPGVKIIEPLLEQSSQIKKIENLVIRWVWTASYQPEEVKNS